MKTATRPPSLLRVLTANPHRGCEVSANMRRQRAQDLRAEVDRLPLGTRQAMLRGVETHPIIVGADGNIRGGMCPMMAASTGSPKQIGKPFARAWDSYAGVRFSRPASRRELLTLKTMLEASIEVESGSPVDLTAAIGSFEAAIEHSHLAESRPAVAAAAPFAPAVGARAAAPAGDPPEFDLGEAITAHEAAKARNRDAERRASERRAAREAERTPRERPDTGERDRSDELEGRHGWAWLRPFRRYDDYERALQVLEDAERAGLAASGGDPGHADSGERELAGCGAGQG